MPDRTQTILVELTREEIEWSLAAFDVVDRLGEQRGRRPSADAEQLKEKLRAALSQPEGGDEGGGVGAGRLSADEDGSQAGPTYGGSGLPASADPAPSATELNPPPPPHCELSGPDLNPLVDLKGGSSDSERHEGETRRYVPASSQDPKPGGPHAEGEDAAEAVLSFGTKLAEAEDRASKAEAERDRLAKLGTERLGRLRETEKVSDLRCEDLERCENALDELATWAEDRSVRLSEAVKVATKEKLIPEELSAKLHATFASKVREKAAKLKGERDGDRG